MQTVVAPSLESAALELAFTPSELVGTEWLPEAHRVEPSALVDPVALRGKRLLDLAIAIPMLLVALPVLLVCAAAIKLTDGGPVLFRQKRVGHRGQMFEVLKLRSMSVGSESLAAHLVGGNVADGLLFRVAADPRVTWIGRIVRRTGIDELPQLLNVLKGEMSIVGPRPLAVAPWDFTRDQHRRHAVLPGLTGLWQVSGGNELPFEEMIDLDLRYIRTWSAWQDLKVLVRTPLALLSRTGPS